MFPDFARLAEAVFNSRQDDVVILRAICDRTDAQRAEFGEDDPRVQAGERQANELKGKFTRRIAWACHQQDARIGLRRKAIGQHATRGDGVAHSTDALMLRDTGEICDVMSDRNWSWNANPADRQPLEEWLDPTPEPGDSVPVPVPTPTPTPTPIDPPVPGSLERKLNELESKVAVTLTRLDELTADLKAKGDRIQVLEDKPAPTLTEFVLPKLVAIGKVPFVGTVRLPVEKA